MRNARVQNDTPTRCDIIVEIIEIVVILKPSLTDRARLCVRLAPRYIDE